MFGVSRFLPIEHPAHRPASLPGLPGPSLPVPLYSQAAQSNFIPGFM